MVSIETFDRSNERYLEADRNRKAFDAVRPQLPSVSVEQVSTWDVEVLRSTARHLALMCSQGKKPEAILTESDSLGSTQKVILLSLLSILCSLNILPDDPRLNPNAVGFLISELTKSNPELANALRLIYEKNSRNFADIRTFMLDQGPLPVMRTPEDAIPYLAFLEEYARSLGFDFHIQQKFEVVFSERHHMKPSGHPAQYVGSIRKALLRLTQILNDPSSQEALSNFFPGINRDTLKEEIVKRLNDSGAFLALPANPVEKIRDALLNVRSTNDDTAQGNYLLREATLLIPNLPINGPTFTNAFRGATSILRVLMPSKAALLPLWQQATASGSTLLEGRAMLTGTMVSPRTSGGNVPIFIGDISPTGFKLGPLADLKDQRIGPPSGISFISSLPEFTPEVGTPEVRKSTPTFGLGIRLANLT